MSGAAALTLGELLAGFAETPAPWADRPVMGLAADSRAVRPGEVFFAVRGGQRHGLDFLAAVRSAGALAVLWEPPWEGTLPDGDFPLLAVPQLRDRMGRITSRFYGEPSRRLPVVGITGTDGKTSCAHFLAQALSDREAGPCGILGTLGFGVHGQTAPSSHTTPDALAVQRWLAGLVAGDQRHAVMEVSSHALDQGRVNGIEFTVAVLTQLSRDHLDYHGTLDAYAAAKRRLFVDCQPSWAVLNGDDAFGQQLATEARARRGIIVYGLSESSTSAERFVWGESLELAEDGLRLQIRSSWGAGELQAGLLGRFNASNLLATLATLLALEMPFADALARLAQTKTAPGRMERLGGQQGQPLAVIDYAHTPHALEQTLRALREHGGHHRLWCVFGCGGDRDPGKRPWMGAVAERLADRIVVTDDNPRTELAERIVEDILAGMQHPREATVIRDRRAAILWALTEAEAGDIVLLAGKGHEDEQIIGAERLPFSDRAVAREFLISIKREIA
ncbi:MAG: UDP-N-acetylmuramoyl-L-alanyl-D-glutamate--2,6-diaminopimelate ligase [Gammaproteobacteria bacterium]|nr:UDP-N-acetylmuramoyl-L-alanyl-D-glutamate--2,6-diaminopimelate ligase [Gammaproteobacteria bacterium]MCP5196605.1 UDP-N-acetylmuramoyl-L-alanyl-D-glutamate--2,6-diaminopimelate ligase [Gammaproteobacteria bacterium]